jgi:hypothetical protein
VLLSALMLEVQRGKDLQLTRKLRETCSFAAEKAQSMHCSEGCDMVGIFVSDIVCTISGRAMLTMVQSDFHR